MPRYQIPYGDAAFVLRRNFPDRWDVVTACKCSVYNQAGTALQAAASTTIYTATTLAAAASRGENTITVDAGAGNLAQGDLIRLTNPKEIREVLSYNASTKVATVTERLDNDHANGSAVTPRWMTYELDASGSSYTSGLDLSIIWDTLDTDDLPVTDEAEILKRTTRAGGLEEHFRVRYPHYYEVLPSNTWDTYEDDSWNELRLIFLSRDRDIDKMISGANINELHMVQIAYMIAMAQDGGWEAEIQMMDLLRTDLLDRFAAAQIWTDTDQDLVKEDSEVQSARRPLPYRTLI